MITDFQAPGGNGEHRSRIAADAGICAFSGIDGDLLADGDSSSAINAQPAMNLYGRVIHNFFPAEGETVKNSVPPVQHPQQQSFHTFSRLSAFQLDFSKLSNSSIWTFAIFS